MNNWEKQFDEKFMERFKGCISWTEGDDFPNDIKQFISKNFVPKSDYRKLQKELQTWKEAYRTKAKVQRTKDYNNTPFMR